MTAVAARATERVPARIGWLTVGTFAIGTDAYVMAGILPDAAGSLGVSVGSAGQLVTVFAVAYALCAPLLAAVTARWPRRRVLLAALAVFVAGNVLTALAPWYPAVLASRVLAAAGAALFTPTAGATAAALAPARRRAAALALVTLGSTSSFALGAPFGTVLGTLVGWRGTIWFVVALGVLAAVGIGARLHGVPTPDVPVGGGVGAVLRARLAPAAHRRTVLVLATTLLMFIGVFVVNVYASVVYARATGGSGRIFAVLLFVSGLAGIAGTLLAGRLADRFGARRILLVVAVVLAADFALLPVLSATMPGAIVASLAYGVAAWAILVPQQHRLVELDPAAAPLAISLNAAAGYVGISLGGALGAAGLSVTSGTWLPWLSVPFALLGLAGSELAHRAARRPRGGAA